MGYKFGSGFAVEVEINDKVYPVMVNANKGKVFETIKGQSEKLQERNDPEAVEEMTDLVLECLDEMLGKEAMDDILSGVPEEDKNLANFVGLAQYVVNEISGAGEQPKTQKLNRAERRRK